MGRTLREHFMGMYKPALNNVISHIDRKGFITSLSAEYYFQKHIDRFERHYVKKYKDLEPFSDEFISIVFTEFHEYIEKNHRIKIIKLSKGEQSYVDYWAIYGFNEKLMEEAHNKYYKKKKQEQENETKILQEHLNKRHE
jgi:hypothetical protein